MQNVGGVDRLIRIVLGIVVMLWSLNAGNFWWIAGAVILATGLFRFCGLYKLLGISTCKLKTPT